ncbi:arsenite methyltransferase [Chloroflexota bacterium]
MKEAEIRKTVREGYAKVATSGSSCCSPASSCGCGNPAEIISRKIGYSDEEIATVPEGANLGLGCGNPVAIASLKEGDTVLDLGSGAGFDCFLAAGRVGESGKIIGVDMTPEMIEKARENAEKGDFRNVEFRLGEIENLPAPDNSVDVVLSNCVINLVPDKTKAFGETFRVLKPGGRFMIADIVLTRELPEIVKQSVQAYIGCLSGAVLKEEYLAKIEEAGFGEVSVVEETSFPVETILNDPMAKALIATFNISSEKVAEVTGSIKSIRVQGVKPA